MKMIAKFAVAFALSAATLVAPHVASAQTLTIDVDTVYQNSVAGKSGSAQLEAKYGPKLKAQQQALQTAVDAWNNQVNAAKKVAKPDGSVPPATEASLSQARQTLNQAKSTYDDTRQEIQYVSQFINYQINDKLIPIAEKIRKDRKADIVVTRGGALAFEPANDVTATAIQQLDATLTTVSITPPQQGAGPAAPAPATTAPAKPATAQPQSR